MRVSLLGAPLALSFMAASGGTTPPTVTPGDSPRATPPPPGPTTANPSPAVEMARQLGGMRLGMTAHLEAERGEQRGLPYARRALMIDSGEQVNQKYLDDVSRDRVDEAALRCREREGKA